MNFKNRLRELRVKNKIGQQTVAEFLNYGYTAISNYESGRNEPSINDLIRLAIFFNVSVDYLVGATDIQLNFKNNDPIINELTWFLEIYSHLPNQLQSNLHNIITHATDMYFYHEIN